MKKRTQKLLALLLVAVMSATVIGCGQTNNEQSKESSQATQSTEVASTVVEEESPINEGFFPIVDEKVTITVGGPDNSTPDWNATEFVKFVEAEMNVKMACATTVSGSWQERFKLQLADETLPDLVLSVNHYITDINMYAEEGFFLKLDEYLDYAPNLKAFLEEHPDYKAMCTASDGHIYGLVKYTESPYTGLSHSFMNRKWLDNLGLKVPETLDDLYNVLKAFKEKDPNGNGIADEVPMIDHNSFTMLWATIMTGFGMPTIRDNCDENYGLMFDKDGKMVVSQTTENYKAFLKYMKKLYDEGLYDKEGFKNSVAAARDKIKANPDNYGLYSDWSAAQSNGLTKTANPQYASINGLSSEWNPEGYIAGGSRVGNVCHVLASAKTEHPEVVIRLIDYLYTQEGIDYVAYGPEKARKTEPLPYAPDYIVTTTVVPAGEEANYTNASDYMTKKARPNAAINLVTPMSAKVAFATSITSPDQLTDEMFVDLGTNAFWAERACTREIKPIITGMLYTAKETEERSVIVTDIKNYLIMTRVQFITGELDIDKDWDTYINTLKQMKIDKLLEIESTAYNRTFGK